MRTCAKCGAQEGALRKQHTRGLRVVLLSEVAGELLCGPCTLGKLEQKQGGVVFPCDGPETVLAPAGIGADQLVVTDHCTGAYLCERPGHVRQARPDGRPLPCAACDPRPVLRTMGGTWNRTRTEEGWVWVAVGPPLDAPLCGQGGIPCRSVAGDRRPSRRAPPPETPR